MRLISPSLDLIQREQHLCQKASWSNITVETIIEAAGWRNVAVGPEVAD